MKNSSFKAKKIIILVGTLFLFSSILVAFIILINSTNKKKMYHMEDCLLKYNEMKMELLDYDDSSIYISKNYRLRKDNNELEIVKDYDDYLKLEYNGNFYISNSGHANIVEDDNSFLFLTTDEDKIYVNYINKDKKFEYKTLDRLDEWIDIYLYFNVRTYIITTDRHSTNIYKYSYDINECLLINNIQCVINDGISYYFEGNGEYIIQDYSRNIYNSIWDTSETINYNRNYYSNNKSLLNEDNFVFFEKNGPNYYGYAIYIDEFYDINNKNDGNKYNYKIGLGKKVDNVFAFNKIISTIDTVGYEVATFVHNSNYYFVAYTPKYTGWNVRYPIEVEKLIVINITPSLDVNYAVIEGKKIDKLYQFSDFLVFEENGKKQTYKM